MIEIFTIPNFDKESRKLAKKYRSLPDDLEKLIDSLEETPVQGDQVYKNMYKVRMSIKSQGKGKRGGARVITVVVIQKTEEQEVTKVALASVYTKNETEDLSDQRYKELKEESGL